jgi:hypothetical protein
MLETLTDNQNRTKTICLVVGKPYGTSLARKAGILRSNSKYSMLLLWTDYYMIGVEENIHIILLEE